MKRAATLSFSIQYPEAVSVSFRNAGESAGKLLTDGSIRSQPNRVFVHSAFLLESDRAESPFNSVPQVHHHCRGIGEQFDAKNIARNVGKYPRNGGSGAWERVLQIPSG